MNLFIKSLALTLITLVSIPAYSTIYQYSNIYGVNVDLDAGPFSWFDGIYLHANIYAVNVNIKAGSEFISTGMIKATNVTVAAKNIKNAQDPNLGLICWSGSFNLNGQLQHYHNPKCDS